LSEQFLYFFSVANIAFTVPYFKYEISWVELLGTVFNLAAVYLAVRNKVLTWPVGLVGVVLFLVLFFQIQLYSDVVEQV
jgi:nicotinamide mononucleotide transporter